MRQRQRGNRQHGEAIVVDHVGVFIGPVGASPVLDDSQAAGGDLFVDPMVQHDHAIGEVFFEPVTGQRAVVSALRRNDRRKVVVVEPTEEEQP